MRTRRSAKSGQAARRLHCKQMTILLQDLILESAERTPEANALRYQNRSLTYATLAAQLHAVAAGYRRLRLERYDRVAVYLEKRFEAVLALFAAAAAGGVYVPVNPQLKPEQVGYILRDCNVRVLVTSSGRLAALQPELSACPDLRSIVVVGDHDTPMPTSLAVVHWDELVASNNLAPTHRSIDSDMVAILYTSGSTGKPKGVVLSHRNVVAGAQSVSQYLKNRATDRLLAVLPFSFDYGFSQLTTGFHRGACVVLINYLLPRDVVTAVGRERITGLAAVPPLWIQLAQLDWPDSVHEHLRYLTNSGGAMPRSVIETLRRRLPHTQLFLMYGLTEAFRSTYLPPSELDRRPDSIGKAIPNAEILIARADGSTCAPGEPGELVHRGALVGLGYWNDPEKTAERYRPAPMQSAGLTRPEIAVWSGDTVRMDEEGFLYFIGRKDDMIKTSGYRVSPTEIEEVIYGTGLVTEAAAFGVAHPTLGQGIVVVAVPIKEGTLDRHALLVACKQHLPTFMVPLLIQSRASLPRNPNGKIDRKHLAHECEGCFEDK
jgi:acyl-CoA ligase (AMP-forming) (exosortase A-associated)